MMTEPKDYAAEEALMFLGIVPGSIAIIFLCFVLFIVIPYFLTTNLHEETMTQWIQDNVESAGNIEYVEEFGDGNWQEKYFLYRIDGELKPFHCWNTAMDSGIDCEGATMEEYRLINRR